MPARQMSLTPDLVARVHRAVADEGPVPGQAMQTDGDYADWVQRALATHPAPDRSTALFAYGSLIWKPEIPHLAESPGRARGWHRAFCYRVPRFRGSHAQPGLMMALQPGGQCQGLLLTLPPDDLAGQLDRLFRREFTAKPNNTMPRWIGVDSEQGRVAALAFVANPASPNHTGRQPAEQVADVLATSCGHWGSGAEYLMNTVAHLEAKGIHDRHLWRLQKLVAERIEAAANHR